MFAIHLDLRNKLVLVVGGGTVGRRKARSLLDAGATVRLVALHPTPAGFTHPSLTWHVEPFREEHLDGVSLVVTAAGPEVDASVAVLARARGLWVNAASDPGAGDLHFPATIQRGRLLVSVGTDGAAPALAAELRDRLEAILPEALATWLDLLDEARTLARETIHDASRRHEIARELAALDGPALLAEQGVEAVREGLRQRVVAG
jgi:siroheme synthase-like protein